MMTNCRVRLVILPILGFLLVQGSLPVRAGPHTRTFMQRSDSSDSSVQAAQHAVQKTSSSLRSGQHFMQKRGSSERTGRTHSKRVSKSASSMRSSRHFMQKRSSSMRSDQHNTQKRSSALRSGQSFLQKRETSSSSDSSQVSFASSGFLGSKKFLEPRSSTQAVEKAGLGSANTDSLEPRGAIAKLAEDTLMEVTTRTGRDHGKLANALALWLLKKAVSNMPKDAIQSKGSFGALLEVADSKAMEASEAELSKVLDAVQSNLFKQVEIGDGNGEAASETASLKSLSRPDLSPEFHVPSEEGAKGGLDSCAIALGTRSCDEPHLPHHYSARLISTEKADSEPTEMHLCCEH